jgi:hypothetical protein
MMTVGTVCPEQGVAQGSKVYQECSVFTSVEYLPLEILNAYHILFLNSTYLVCIHFNKNSLFSQCSRSKLVVVTKQSQFHHFFEVGPSAVGMCGKEGISLKFMIMAHDGASRIFKHLRGEFGKKNYEWYN